MVKISNGKITMRVTPGSFHNFYKKRGFNVIELPSSPESSTPEERDIPPQEISLDQMTFPQLVEYARLMGIDPEGFRSKKELRMHIKESL